MARNKGKYTYYLVGILTDSPTHRAFLADAEKSSAKQLPTLISTRLGDYYEIMQKHAIVEQQSPLPKEEEKPNNGYSAIASTNAAQALDEWAD